MHILLEGRAGSDHPLWAKPYPAEGAVKAESQLHFSVSFMPFENGFERFHPFSVQASSHEMGASLAEQASFKACTETPRSLISLTGASSSESSSESGE